MKLKRCLFILSLTVLFGVCFYIMNQHYDSLARYPYATDDNRELLLEYFDHEDIDYLVTQQIKPEEFLPFIELENFDLHNTRWYNKALQTQENDLEYIVSFVNKYKEKLDYSTLDQLLTSYSYNELTRFFDEQSQQKKTLDLIPNAYDQNLVIKEGETVYTYEPKDLQVVSEIPRKEENGEVHEIYVREAVVEPLYEMYNAILEAIPEMKDDLKLVQGYVSYDMQKQWQTAVTTKDKEKETVVETPALIGQNEFQLGFSVVFGFEKEASEEVAVWLKEHAYQYGFVLRYPEGKEAITKHEYEPYTLRFVGSEQAKTMWEGQLTLEQVK